MGSSISYVSTISSQILVLSNKEHQYLTETAEALAQETILAEELLNKHLRLTKVLRIGKKVRKHLEKMKTYQATQNVRLMRFDFHLTAANTWVISEVNSDVPGGFAEASLLPKIALKLIKDKDLYFYQDFGETLCQTIASKIKPKANIALVHCTSYSDDRQVMQFLGDKFIALGFNAIYCAADQLVFHNNKAYCSLFKNKTEIDAIVRFSPVEWFRFLKSNYWPGYFSTNTLSCNFPIAVFAQTKRFPFVWPQLEQLGLQLTYWRNLLPETRETKAAKKAAGFIYKPVWGRVGEDITIKEAIPPQEYKKIMKNVKRHPNSYVAQKKFDSQALVNDNGESFHLCLGLHCIEGKAAGYYGRISKTARIDSSATDIPVLIER